MACLAPNHLAAIVRKRRIKKPDSVLTESAERSFLACLLDRERVLATSPRDDRSSISRNLAQRITAGVYIGKLFIKISDMNIAHPVGVNCAT